MSDRFAAARVALEDRRIGELVRLQRRRKGLRQEDIAVEAGVCRQTISLVERGQLEGLTVRVVRIVTLAAGVLLPFEARCDGAALDRVRDAGHARIVDELVGLLTSLGWTTKVEYSFNHYGDRGSVDLLAWHAPSRSLLIVEVKTQLTDVQALLRSLDVKQRVVSGLVRRDLGWHAASVGVVVVLPDTRTQRRIVERHGAMFAAALPARNVVVRRWMRQPAGSLRGIWFVGRTATGRGPA